MSNTVKATIAVVTATALLCASFVKFYRLGFKKGEEYGRR